MQSTNRRAFSLLASKIHPQLPLSPRESQQLLTLLTTSFRAHLDREHPIAPPRPNQYHNRNAPSSHVVSSHNHATQHIDSILTNPLFAPRPRRPSNSSKLHVREVMKDPLSWFLDQVAFGTADIAKADVCLGMLGRAAERRAGKKPGEQIALWLETSGLDKSREFYTTPRLMQQLIPLLLEEGRSHHLWNWLRYTPPQDTIGAGVDQPTLTRFRRNLTKHIILASLGSTPNSNPALTVFKRMQEMLSSIQCPELGRVLQGPGSVLSDHLLAGTKNVTAPDLYESFLQSASIWGGKWRESIQASLWLHHPTKPSAEMGLAFLKDPNGATLRRQNASLTRREFLVQLYLGVARQLLVEQKFTDAYFALQLAKEHYPDLVGAGAEPSTTAEVKGRDPNRQKERRELKNLAMLDRLLPT